MATDPCIQRSSKHIWCGLWKATPWPVELLAKLCHFRWIVRLLSWSSTMTMTPFSFHLLGLWRYFPLMGILVCILDTKISNLPGQLPWEADPKRNSITKRYLNMCQQGKGKAGAEEQDGWMAICHRSAFKACCGSNGPCRERIYQGKGPGDCKNQENREGETQAADSLWCLSIGWTANATRRNPHKVWEKEIEKCSH